MRQAVGDREAVGKGLERAGEVALRDLHVADLVVRHREIAPPAGVAGIGLRQAVEDREAVGKGLERAGEVALRDLHVANPVVRHREIAIVATSGGGVARGGKGLRRLSQRASGDPEIAQVDPKPDVVRIEARGFGEFGASRVVVELQLVDARLVGEKCGFGSTGLLAQSAGALASLVQGGASGVELAFVDQRRGAGADGGEFRPVVAESREVGAQADQFVGGFGEAVGDFGFRNLGLAEPLQHFAQRRFGNAFCSGDFGEPAIERLLETRLTPSSSRPIWIGLLVLSPEMATLSPVALAVRPLVGQVA